MDAVGGEFNAFTEKEHTCFYATVLDRDLPLAIDIVSDVVLEATVRADDVEVERSVVLEEIAMRDDDPSDRVHDEFSEALFGRTPLGRPILGTVDSINALTRSQIAGYYRRRYQPGSMIVAAAGNLDHASVLRHVRRAFAGHLDSAAAAARRTPGRRRGGARPSTRRARRRHRAGQHRPRRARAVAPRRAPVRPRRAQRGGRRRDELAAVPEHPRAARAGVLGLLVHEQLHRHGRVRRLRRLPAE